MTASSDLLLPLEALCRVRVFSRPRALSATSFAPADFSFPLSLFFSSSFFFVGEGALSDKSNTLKSEFSRHSRRRLAARIAINAITPPPQKKGGIIKDKPQKCPQTTAEIRMMAWFKSKLSTEERNTTDTS